MNIFNHFTKQFTTNRHIDSISFRTRMRNARALGTINVFDVVNLGSIDCGRLARILGGISSAYLPLIPGLEYVICEDGTININRPTITGSDTIIKILRMSETYCHINDIDNTQERGILMEMARVLCSILQHGHMPEEYLNDSEDESIESEPQLHYEELKFPEDEYEDVFHGDTLIERIKNCGDIYGDAKAFPIIVRNGSQEMQIIDTSIENNVLYIDVKDIIKEPKLKPRTRRTVSERIEQMALGGPADIGLSINPVDIENSYINWYSSLNSNINTTTAGELSAASTSF